MRTPTCTNPRQWTAEFLHQRRYTMARVEAGHLWSADDHGLEIRLWWRLPFGQTHFTGQLIPHKIIESSSREELRKYIADAVRRARHLLFVRKQIVRDHIRYGSPRNAKVT